MLINTLPTSIPEILEFISSSGGKHAERNCLLYRMRPYWTTSELSKLKIGEVMNSDGTIRTHWENDQRRIEFSPDFQNEIKNYLCERFNLPEHKLNKLVPHFWDTLFASQKGSRLEGTTSPRAFSPDGNTLRQFFSASDRKIREAFAEAT